MKHDWQLITKKLLMLVPNTYERKNYEMEQIWFFETKTSNGSIPQLNNGYDDNFYEFMVELC